MRLHAYSTDVSSSAELPGSGSGFKNGKGTVDKSACIHASAAGTYCEITSVTPTMRSTERRVQRGRVWRWACRQAAESISGVRERCAAAERGGDTSPACHVGAGQCRHPALQRRLGRNAPVRPLPPPCAPLPLPLPLPLVTEPSFPANPNIHLRVPIALLPNYWCNSTAAA